jgi:hypothetical protein
LFDSKSKINDFDFSFSAIDHDIFWFDVSVYDTFFVDVAEAETSLEENALYLVFLESVLLSFIKLKNVFRDVLKNDHNLLFMFGFSKLVDFDDVGVIDFFEDLGLLDGNGKVIDHGFYSNNLLSRDVFGKVDGAEVAIADFGSEVKLFLNLTRHFYCYLYSYCFISFSIASNKMQLRTASI